MSVRPQPELPETTPAPLPRLSLPDEIADDKNPLRTGSGATRSERRAGGSPKKKDKDGKGASPATSRGSTVTRNPRRSPTRRQG